MRFSVASCGNFDECSQVFADMRRLQTSNDFFIEIVRWAEDTPSRTTTLEWVVCALGAVVVMQDFILTIILAWISLSHSKLKTARVLSGICYLVLGVFTILSLYFCSQFFDFNKNIPHTTGQFTTLASAGLFSGFTTGTLFFFLQYWLSFCSIIDNLQGLDFTEVSLEPISNK
jgi:hypothetical protein